jgi:hypothetical protein
MAVLQQRSKPTIKFISSATSEEDTMWNFEKNLDWTTMPPETAVGHHGKALLARFGVTTIPALVLLDGDGWVICTDQCLCLAANLTGLGFPWQQPAVAWGGPIPHVEFTLVPTLAQPAVKDQAPS